MTAHAPPKLLPALEIQLLPPVPRVCVRGSGFLLRLTPLWSQGWQSRLCSTPPGFTGRRGGSGKTQKKAQHWPTDPAITCSPSSRIAQGRGGNKEGKEKEREEEKKEKKENPENSSLANVVKPSGRSSFALQKQRRKSTLNEKKQGRSVAFFLIVAVF